MQLVRLRVSGFRSVGPLPVDFTFEKLTFLLGPNGTGKTVVLHALARMFGSEMSLRRFVAADFHVPMDEVPETSTARQLWLEADFTFPELADGRADASAVAPFFAHMRMETAGGPPVVRIRLTADLDESGDISEEMSYVLATDAVGEPTHRASFSRYDRNAIQVHYLPARRNPKDHVSYAASALLGRLLRAADWELERTTVATLSRNLSDALAANAGVAEMGTRLTAHWKSLHSGTYLSTTTLSFLRSEIEGALSHVSVELSPGPGQEVVDFSRLSDGEQSLLYITLVLTAHAIGRDVLASPSPSFDLERLRPPVYTLLAVEEPENSLSPHYLGRVLAALHEMTKTGDAQGVVATHSPSLLRRVEPEQVRYLRLDDKRRTVVASVRLPARTDDAHKFVREALHAYPELYFSRLVVLGEGDSEEVVLPRLLRSRGLQADAGSISVVPLGGRHVNHFWRLLNDLGIPHVTLLDLDQGRHRGGWGRLHYAASALLTYAAPDGLEQKHIDVMDGRLGDVRGEKAGQVVTYLERHGVYFSSPLDLDFALLQVFPDAYGVEATERLAPDAAIVTAVLGKTGDVSGYTADEQELFGAYHRLFQVGSKPTQHILAMTNLDDIDVVLGVPDAFSRLAAKVAEILAGLPE